MKYIGYLWLILKNLIVLFIVFAIFAKANNSFETIVFSLLVLIYLGLDTFSTLYGLFTVQAAIALDSELKRIRRLLKEEESESEKEEIREVKKKLDRAWIKTYINGAFLFIIYLIALFNLFAAL